jgi:hypothetical protein
LRVKPLRRQQPSEELFAITSPLVAQTQIGAAAPKKEVISGSWKLAGPKRFELLTPRFVVSAPIVTRDDTTWADPT